MFIKLHVKNSIGEKIPLMINADLICTIEPIINGRSYIVFHDQRVLTVEETFDQIAQRIG